MIDSILDTIKTMLGIDPTFTGFDAELAVVINTVFMTLNDLGVGTTETFGITGSDEVWSDFLEGNVEIEGVKSYIFIKTKLMFDPPSSSFVLEAFNRTVTELEWRLTARVEPPFVPVVPEDPEE